MRSALSGVTNDDVRSTAERRAQIERVVREQKGILAGEKLPAHLWLGENTFPVYVTHVTRGGTLFNFNTLVELLRFTVDPVQYFRLDFLAVSTSNFDPGIDDDDIEYRLLQNGSIIRPFDRWLGLTTPLQNPRRQMSNFLFAPGALIQFMARVLGPTEGGPSTSGSLDIRAELFGSLVTA